MRTSVDQTRKKLRAYKGASAKGESGYHLSSKAIPNSAYIWAILSGIDDEPVELGVAAVEEADMGYSFLAGSMKQQSTRVSDEAFITEPPVKKPTAKFAGAKCARAGQGPVVAWRQANISGTGSRAVVVTRTKSTTGLKPIRHGGPRTWAWSSSTQTVFSLELFGCIRRAGCCDS